MTERKPAPVQRSERGYIAPEIAEAAYEDYARLYGTRQSLERLNQRGGCGWAELVFHLYRQLAIERGEPELDGSFSSLIHGERPRYTSPPVAPSNPGGNPERLGQCPLCEENRALIALVRASEADK